MTNKNKYQLSHHTTGLTLLEVLVALVILSIALSAAIKVTAQSIRQTLYLQDRTLATFAGMTILNEFRLGLRRNEGAGEERGQTTFLNQTFTWRAIISSTHNPAIQEIRLRVGTASDDDSQSQQLANLTGYLDAPTK